MKTTTSPRFRVILTPPDAPRPTLDETLDAALKSGHVIIQAAYGDEAYEAAFTILQDFARCLRFPVMVVRGIANPTMKTTTLNPASSHARALHTATGSVDGAASVSSLFPANIPADSIELIALGRLHASPVETGYMAFLPLDKACRELQPNLPPAVAALLADNAANLPDCLVAVSVQPAPVPFAPRPHQLQAGIPVPELPATPEPRMDPQDSQTPACGHPPTP